MSLAAGTGSNLPCSNLIPPNEEYYREETFESTFEKMKTLNPGQRDRNPDPRDLADVVSGVPFL